MDLKLSDYLYNYNEIKKNSPYSDKKNIKIAVLRSYSCETLEPVLCSKLFKKGFFCDFLLGEYNQFFQEVLNSQSNLYSFNPDIVIFNIRLEDFYPIIFENYFDELSNIEFHKNKICEDIENLLLTLRSSSKAGIILNTFSKPYYSPFGIFQSQGKNGINNLLRYINYKLCSFAEDTEGIYILDNEEIISRLGVQSIYDLRMWSVAKNPYKLNYYNALADGIVKTISAIYGIRKKCICVDLDNTLWKGIIGEDGFEKIKINTDFQRQLLFLKQTGTILAIDSKNNYEDAIRVLSEHHDMLLKKDDFTVIKINWEDKAKNLREIAEELNIGLDSIIFIDDNSAECELIRTELPEVCVVELPKSNLEYADLIRALDIDFLQLTDEDLNKTDIYKSQMERSKLSAKSTDINTFLKSLEMTAEIEKANDYLIPRIAQLTQKTNQFNLTTRRYTEENIRKLIKDGFIIYTLRLIDKFGDNGITGLIILKPEGDSLIIDTFLLSCRIMNRNAENALLGFVISENRDKFKALIGEYIETAKNKPVRDLYKNLGFIQNESKWQFDMTKKFEAPSYIKITKKE